MNACVLSKARLAAKKVFMVLSQRLLNCNVSVTYGNKANDYCTHLIRKGNPCKTHNEIFATQVLDSRRICQRQSAKAKKSKASSEQ